MILKWTTLSPLPSNLKHALFSLLLDWFKCIFSKGAPAVKTETRSRGPSNGSCRQVLLDATLCYDHNVRNSHHPDKFSLRISSHVLSWAWFKCIFSKAAPALKTETRSRGPSNGSCRQVLLDATLCYDHNVRNSHHPDKFSLRISSHVLSWACVQKYASGICKEYTEPVFSLFTWQHKNWVLSIQWYSAENSGHFQGRIILSKKYHWIPQHLCPSNKASMQQLHGTTTFLTN